MAEFSLPYGYTPRDYQFPLWRHFMGPRKGKRAVVVRHRRGGKDLDAINIMATLGIGATVDGVDNGMPARVGTYWHAFPTYAQGRKVIWDGTTNEGRRFLDYFPPDAIESRHENEMRIRFKNGSVYKIVGSDDMDSLRGTNPVFVTLSEYQDCNPELWNKVVEPILIANGGHALFVGTPRGRNHFFEIYEYARQQRNWYHEYLTILDTKLHDGSPVVPREFVDEILQRPGVDEASVMAEYFCSWDESVSGSIYGKQVARMEEQKRITKVPYDPHLQAHTAWDVGFADSTVIGFFQLNGDAIQLYDCYEARGEALSHYARLVTDRAIKNDWVYGSHFVPHDMASHDLTIGRRRIDVMRELGVKMQLVDKHALDDGIEQTRALMEKMWIDERKCARLILALKGYHREYDEKLKRLKDNPVHGWESHFCDMLRYLAMSFRHRKKRLGDLPTTAVDDYHYV